MKRKDSAKREKQDRPADKKPGISDAEIEKLSQQLQDAQAEHDELFAKLQRVSADYANYQKRAPKQIAEAVAYEKEALIKSLLPALDNFEHALAGAESAGNSLAVLDGVRIVYNHFLDILKSCGVEQISALGQKFDPALHQAMTQRQENDKQDGTVLEEFQKGYKLNGRVIRPSKVVVNKPSDQEQPESERPAQERAEEATEVNETTDKE